MDRQVKVVTFTGYGEVTEVDLPSPKFMTFSCGCPSQSCAIQMTAEKKGAKVGELLTYQTINGLHDLLSLNELVRTNCAQFIKKSVEQGVKELWLVSHTECQSDRRKHGELAFDQDLRMQEQKLLQCTKKILDISNQFRLELKVVPVLMKITGQKGLLYPITFSRLPTDDERVKQSVFSIAAKVAAK